MVQRVVFGALPGGGHGLRVSRPGYNVLSTGLQPNQVSFDSRWSNALKVFLSGSISVPLATGAHQYTTVSFGKTFSTPPICLAWSTDAGGNIRFMTNDWFSTDWTDVTRYDPCRVFTNRVEFRREFSTQMGAYTARYVILEGD